jgi:hypothetical protein
VRSPGGKIDYRPWRRHAPQDKACFYPSVYVDTHGETVRITPPLHIRVRVEIRGSIMIRSD